MKEHRIRFRPEIILIAAILFAAAAIYFYIPYPGSDDVKSFINGYGAAAPLVFIIICAAKPILFFLPSMGLTIIAGTLFGPVYGTIYCVIGGAGSTAVGFYMTRYFARQRIEKFLLEHKTLLRVDEKMSTDGFRTILMLRLFNLPWDAVSYCAGLSRMKFRGFYLASIIALGPASFIYVYFGSTVFKPVSAGFIISLAVIFLLGSLPYVFKKRKVKDE